MTKKNYSSPILIETREFLLYINYRLFLKVEITSGNDSCFAWFNNKKELLMVKKNHIGAIICPNCSKLINANTSECIHCGLKNPGRKNLLSSVFQGNIGFVQMVTIFCIALYIFSIVIDPASLIRRSGLFNFLSPSSYSLDKLGMTGSVAMYYGRWWTLVTAIYLHGGLLHIVFNLLWIRQLGPMVEEFFSRSRLIIIFTVSGVFGFIISNFVGITFTIGASGSIFGLMGALVFYGRDRGGVFGQAIFRQLMGWAIMIFIFGFLMPGINNFAHGGGFVGGYLAARLLGYNEKKTESLSHKTGASIALITTVVCFLFAFWHSLG